MSVKKILRWLSTPSPIGVGSITILVIILIILYLYPSFIYEALPEIFGTMMGLIIGYELSSYQQNILEEQEEKELVKKFVESLLQELVSNKKNLELSKQIKERYPNKNENFVYGLSHVAYDSIVYSGKLYLLRLETQRILYIYYVEGIKKWNILADRYDAEAKQLGRPETITLNRLFIVYDALIKLSSEVERILNEEHEV